MRAIKFILAILFSIAIASCGGGGGGGTTPDTTTPITTTPDTTTPDTTPPTVSSVSPVHSATGVLWSAAISTTFNEPMLSSSITPATFTVGGATGTVNYSGTTATFTPSSELTAGTTYIVTITTGVKDAAGNQMSGNYTWTFTACIPAFVDPNLYSTLGDYQRALAAADAACRG